MTITNDPTSHQFQSPVLSSGTSDYRTAPVSVCMCINTLVHVKGENGLSPRMCSKRFIRAVVPVNQSSALPGIAATFPTEHYY